MPYYDGVKKQEISCELPKVSGPALAPPPPRRKKKRGPAIFVFDQSRQTKRQQKSDRPSRHDTMIQQQAAEQPLGTLRACTGYIACARASESSNNVAGPWPCARFFLVTFFVLLLFVLFPFPVHSSFCILPSLHVSLFRRFPS